MSWLTSPEEPKIVMEFTLQELRHIISGLLALNNEPSTDLDSMETNDRMIGLLLQLENDLVDDMNRDEADEDHVREFGEA